MDAYIFEKEHHDRLQFVSLESFFKVFVIFTVQLLLSNCPFKTPQYLLSTISVISLGGLCWQEASDTTTCVTSGVRNTDTAEQRCSSVPLLLSLTDGVECVCVSSHATFKAAGGS